MIMLVGMGTCMLTFTLEITVEAQCKIFLSAADTGEPKWFEVVCLPLQIFGMVDLNVDEQKGVLS